MTSTQILTVPTESIWTGNTSTDWYDATNWVGCVPSLTRDGRIPAGRPNYPSITAASTALVRTLTIENGGALTMNTATLRVAGNFLNQNTTAIALTGAVQLEGSSPAIISVGTLDNLTVNLVGGMVALPRNLTINTALTLTSGLLNTGSYAITLAPTATLSETESSYVTGTVRTTRSLVPGTTNTFGGLGLTLTPAAASVAPGSTVVTRTTGTALTGVGASQSVRRSFNIQPATNSGLNVSMVFGYFDHELNSIAEANLSLFRSTSGTAGPWQNYSQQGLDASANTVTRNGIAAFSLWTLGNSTNPLPVELVAFTAKAQGTAAVALAWRTASEKNSAYFEVERSLNGTDFGKMATVRAQGNTVATSNYSLLDAQLPTAAKTLYYRLRQVDQDGTATYSSVQSVALAGRTALLTLSPNPAHTTVGLSGAVADTAVLVLDALGRVMTMTTTDAAGNATLALPAGLASSVYVVRIGTESTRLTIE